MPYIVDGNNLLGLSPDLRIKDPGARERLVRALAIFARGKRTRVTVVFDGDPAPGFSGPGMHLGDVQILFAGRATDADSRILEILAAAPDPAGYILVTSDRALGDRARRLRARIITSLRFRRTLDEVAAPGRAGEERLSAEEVADWEAWFKQRDAE